MKPTSSPSLAPREIGHRALAFFAPFLAVAAATSLFLDRYPGANPPPAYFWISLAGCGLAALAVSAIARLERASAFTRYRGLFIALPITLAIKALMTSGSLEERLAMDFGFLFCAACVTAQWIVSMDIECVFLDREALARDLGALEGARLAASIKAERSLVQESGYAFTKVAVGCAATAAVLVLVAFTGHAAGKPASPGSTVSLGLFTVLVVLAFALRAAYADEDSLASVGFRGSFSFAGHRVRAVLAILAASAILALILSGDKPLIKADFFAGLFERLRPRSANALLLIPEGEREASAGDTTALARLLASETRPAPRALVLFFAAFKFLARATGAVLILAFLFGPFLKKSFRSFVSERRLDLYVGNFLASLAAFLRGLFARLPRPDANALRENPRSAPRRASERGAGRRPSLAKRRETGRLAERFSRVVDWGEARGVRCAPSAGPLEYASSLAERYPAIAGQLVTAASVLEKSLYSADLIEPGEAAAFKEAVREILARPYASSGS